MLRYLRLAFVCLLGLAIAAALAASLLPFIGTKWWVKGAGAR